MRLAINLFVIGALAFLIAVVLWYAWMATKNAEKLRIIEEITRLPSLCSIGSCDCGKRYGRKMAAIRQVAIDGPLDSACFTPQEWASLTGRLERL
jgi:hypothetical protein